VIDALDDCPVVAGLKESKGCPPPVVAPAPAPVVAEVAPRSEGNLDSLFDTVGYFRKDKSWIGPMNARKLDRIIELLNEYPQVNVKLQGHTDYRQTEQYNEGLAERRVESVRRYLIKRGVKANRFKGEAFSELVPASKTDLQLNRRVEVHIWK
jgi:OOP family OmpA-OmpF porin